MYTCFNKYNEMRSVPSLYRLTGHSVYNNKKKKHIQNNIKRKNIK